jgi:uncharacterized membrane protein
LSSENIDSLDGPPAVKVLAMNRTLWLMLCLAACAPQQVTPVPLVEALAVSTPDQLTGFPCDVREVLQAKCAACHAGQTYVTQFKSRADLLEQSGTGPHALGVELAARLRPDAIAPMPPTGSAKQLAIAERQLLDGWSASGMPGGSCGELVDE